MAGGYSNWRGREDLATVLRLCRREISRERRMLLDSHALKDSRGRTRMDTIDPEVKPDVDRKTLIINAIDLVLG